MRWQDCKVCKELENNWNVARANQHYVAFGHMNWRQMNNAGMKEKD